MNCVASLLSESAETRPANFDRIAGVYRWMEWLTFGPTLWRCRCAFLDPMEASRRALILGDGDGRFTARLLERNPHVTVNALDASEAMLRQLLRRSAPNNGRVHARVADARTQLRLSGGFDLVVTHFFLDCLTTEEVESLVDDIRKKLAPGAQWIISEFAVPKNLYGRLVARPLISALYLAFALLTGLKVRRLPRYREALERAGMVLVREKRRMYGLLVSELWQFGHAVVPARQ